MPLSGLSSFLFPARTRVVNFACSLYSCHSTALGGRRSAPIDAVLDCVGVEQEPMAIHQALGSVYISLASPELRALEEDGALAMARARWAARDKPAREGSRVWTAGELAVEAMVEVIYSTVIQPSPAM